MSDKQHFILKKLSLYRKTILVLRNNSVLNENEYSDYISYYSDCVKHNNIIMV